MGGRARLSAAEKAIARAQLSEEEEAHPLRPAKTNKTTQLRFVPSFNDFNSNISNPMPVHAPSGGAAVAASAPRRAAAAPSAPGAVDVARVDLAEGESAAAKGPRSPAAVFADALYENLRQT